MPRRPAESIPAMQLHRASGQARVNLSGRDVYLGEWGSDAAATEYDRVINQWLALGRVWPPPPDHQLTLGQLYAKYAAHADAFYRKRGKPTSTATQIAHVRDLLTECGLGDFPALSIRPRHLVAFRDHLLRWEDVTPAGDRVPHLARRTINNYVSMVVGAFKWWISRASDSLTAEVTTLHQSLLATPRLKRGRAPEAGLPVPREGARRKRPIPDADIAAVIAAARPMLASMIRLQRAAAMRPGEVCGLRACLLQPTEIPGVFAYNVPADFNKVDHCEIERVVFLGPAAMAEIRQWLPDDPAAFVFSPRRAVADFNAAKRAARRTPLKPSDDPRRRRMAKGKPDPHAVPPADHYTSMSYGKAVKRACALAQLPRDRWWSVNRLRHTGATEIVLADGLLTAQQILGHRHIATTQTYTWTAAEKSAMVAALKR